MPLITPLKTNHHVALVCPGSICVSPKHPLMTKEFLQKNYQLHAEFSEETTRVFTPKDRAAIFLNYLFNDEIKLIAALRGGEGTADIIPYIHEQRSKIVALKPKWLLGFSDFTPLLLYFSQHYHWPVIHGSSVLCFASNRVDTQTEQSTMNLLFGNSSTVHMDHLVPLNKQAEAHTTITAQLTGGCLSLIDISIKDIWEIDTKNKIIFIEDVGEKAHKIIRTLKYFSRIGVFSKVKAIILGDFTCQPIGSEAEQEQNRLNILKILSSFAAHQTIPVLYSTQFGHGKTNLPLMYCAPYQLQLGERPALSRVS